MNFKLTFSIPPSEEQIKLTDGIYLMGSCFSDEIGSLLTKYKFNALSNPFGTIYNPASICQLLTQSIDLENLVEHEGIYYHWNSHGKISGLNREEVQDRLQKAVHVSDQHLQQSNWVIITLGTSWVYRHHSSGEIVANCHRIPNTEFSKELMTSEAIIQQLENLYETLSSRFPTLKFIFTVSPVRHLKDGVIENNRSKARLIEAVHTVVHKYKKAHYFPSYEIIMDELRDYRFYEQDLSHPNSLAINYIWERFSETYFAPSTRSTIGQLDGIFTALNHRAFHPKSAAHQKFLKETLEKMEKMNEAIDLSVEMETLKAQIL